MRNHANGGQPYTSLAAFARIGILAGALALPASAEAQAPSTASSGTEREAQWDMHELAPGVYASIVAAPTHPSARSNSLIVVQSDHVVVVDTRGSAETARRLIADIRRITDKPVTAVINTHWHEDHVGGNGAFLEEFPGVRIFAHAQTRAKIVAEGGTGAPTDTVVAEYALDADEREVRIIFPGVAHTSGDLVVYLPQERLLAIGDLIEQGFPYFGDGSVVGSAWALDRLALLSVDRVLPSHARIQERTDLLTAQRSFFRAIVDGARIDADDPEPFEAFRNHFTGGNDEVDERYDAFVADLLARAAVESDTLRTFANACASEKHRAFDFWIGRWDVTGPQGNVVGHNRIESIHGGCALRENWTGATGSIGQSFNTYDRTRDQWHQSWVDNSGLLLQLDGQPFDGGMRLSGENVGPDGTVTVSRITWTVEAEDGSLVRQLWESSTDGGETWSVAFNGLYRRVGPH